MKSFARSIRAMIPALLVLLVLAALAGCDKWWESDSPTAPDDRIPFGAPVDSWNTGIGSMDVFEQGGPEWTGALEAAFQSDLDDLLATLERVAGSKTRAGLSLAGEDLVLQQSTSKPRYSDSLHAFYVSGSSEFQKLALDYFCGQSKSDEICRLR